MTDVRLWIAQGFGVGRINVAPGTCGSVVGLLWFGLLVMSGLPWVYLAGTFAGVFLAVYLCGWAENALRTKDHQSIVLDEIAAMPVCFLGPMSDADLWSNASGPFTLACTRNLIYVGLIFAGFRFFDIVKPWPARQSQNLRGGLGVTADDLIAAGYVNLAWFAVRALL